MIQTSFRWPMRAALALALLALAGPALGQVTTRNLVLRGHKHDYSPIPPGTAAYSACWGYVHPLDVPPRREYAVIGTFTGTAIYNVSNPSTPYQVGFIPGTALPNAWREFKSYRTWIYAVTEGTGSGEGLQIIRMTDPEHPVLAATYTGSFNHSHTIAIDTTRAILICNGTRDGTGCQQGMRILSIANPEAPVEIAVYPNPIPSPCGAWQDSLYVHDSVPIGNRLYASSIYRGIERVFDFTIPSAPVQIAKWQYPGAFSHNSWPDATGNWLYITDEVQGEPLKVFDISNLGAPVLYNGYTPNPGAVVHNAHVKGNELYLANYTEGIRALDVSDPAHPAEFAFADSYPGASGYFNGVWEVYPFFPSGTVIASDRQTGLYVYEVQRNYGLVRVQVELPGGAPLAGAKVYDTSSGDSSVTTADGVAVFAANPGSHTMLAKKFGYSDASTTRPVTQGSRDTLKLTLAPRPMVSFSGMVHSAVTQAPLEGAEVNLSYTPVHLHTMADGMYSASVPADDYRVEVRRPGYIPLIFNRTIGPDPVVQHFDLVPVTAYDDFEGAPGFTVGVSGDNATQGLWTRVDPIGTGSIVTGGTSLRGPNLPETLSQGVPRPEDPGLFHEGHSEGEGATGPAQPEDDRTPPPGTMCFVTGQGGNPVSAFDVDGGRTTLLSPAYDCTGMIDPVIGYWSWFYTSGDLVFDWLVVAISNNNGSSWTVVDTTRDLHNHWTEHELHVADYVAPTSQVRVKFEAADWDNESIVEAGIDDVSFYDGATTSVPPPPGTSRLAFRAPQPNPANGPVNLTLDVPAAGKLRVDVVDLQGRRITRLFDGVAAAGPLRLVWKGLDDTGRSAAAGLYFARATGAGGEARTRFVTTN